MRFQEHCGDSCFMAAPTHFSNPNFWQSTAGLGRQRITKLTRKCFFFLKKKKSCFFCFSEVVFVFRLSVQTFACFGMLSNLSEVEFSTSRNLFFFLASEKLCSAILPISTSSSENLSFHSVFRLGPVFGRTPGLFLYDLILWHEEFCDCRDTLLL